MNSALASLFSNTPNPSDWIAKRHHSRVRAETTLEYFANELLSCLRSFTNGASIKELENSLGISQVRIRTALVPLTKKGFVCSRGTNKKTYFSTDKAGAYIQDRTKRNPSPSHAVLAHLLSSGEPQTMRQISNATGIAKEVVLAYLYKMRKAGTVTAVPVDKDAVAGTPDGHVQLTYEAGDCDE